MIYVFMITFLSLSVVDNNNRGFFIEHQPPHQYIKFIIIAVGIFVVW